MGARFGRHGGRAVHGSADRSLREQTWGMGRENQRGQRQS